MYFNNSIESFVFFGALQVIFLLYTVSIIRLKNIAKRRLVPIQLVTCLIVPILNAILFSMYFADHFSSGLHMGFLSGFRGLGLFLSAAFTMVLNVLLMAIINFTIRSKLIFRFNKQMLLMVIVFVIFIGGIIQWLLSLSLENPLR